MKFRKLISLISFIILLLCFVCDDKNSNPRGTMIYTNYNAISLLLNCIAYKSYVFHPQVMFFIHMGIVICSMLLQNIVRDSFSLYFHFSYCIEVCYCCKTEILTYNTESYVIVFIDVFIGGLQFHWIY